MGEHKPRVLENRTEQNRTELKRIFGLRREEIGTPRKEHDEELRNLGSWANIIRSIK
jgi:hypothetical protein